MKTAILILLLAVIACSGVLPDTTKTPGDTVPGIMLMDLCNPEFLSPQPVTIPTIKKVMLLYKIPPAVMNAYVYDQLIPVNLGGSADVKNVWPQTKIFADKKDRLELKLNWMVCNAKLSIKEARYIIKFDWLTAYRLYVLGDTSAHVYY